MKQAIHPKYEKTVIKCACGNEIETKSTVFPEIRIELCSACHPFYTGKQKFVDTAGRVDKFRARLEKARAKNTVAPKAAEKVLEKSNAEKLAEIKKEIKTEPKADLTEQEIVLTQTDDSQVAESAGEALQDLDKVENKESK